MKAWHAVVACIVAAMLIACSDPQPEPTRTPAVQICIEDGRKVDCE